MGPSFLRGIDYLCSLAAGLRSVLRRHVGRVLLNKQIEGLCSGGDMLLFLCRQLQQWEICLISGYIFVDSDMRLQYIL